MNRERYQRLSEEQRERLRQQGRLWYEKNREKRIEQGRKWREENLERKRKIMRESARRRRIEHPEITRAIERKSRENESPERRRQRLAKIREWHETHRAQAAELNRRWAAKNVEKERIRGRNREAWYRGAVGRYTASDIQALYEKQGGKCAICAVVFPETGSHRFQIDHIIPLKPRGASTPVGTNNPDNLQLLCRKCNRLKWNHLPPGLG